MNKFIRDLWHDLRSRRLWPVALVLVVALVAVPVVLKKSPHSEAAPLPTNTSTPADQKSVVVAATDTATGSSTLRVFSSKNPFKPNLPKAKSGEHRHDRPDHERPEQLQRLERLERLQRLERRLRQRLLRQRRLGHGRQHAEDPDEDRLRLHGEREVRQARRDAKPPQRAEARRAAERQDPAARLHGRDQRWQHRRLPGRHEPEGQRRGRLQAEPGRLLLPLPEARCPARHRGSARARTPTAPAPSTRSSCSTSTKLAAEQGGRRLGKAGEAAGRRRSPSGQQGRLAAPLLLQPSQLPDQVDG